MKAIELVEDLIYANYRHNRLLSPMTEPEQWEPIFGEDTLAMEGRFQSEMHESFLRDLDDDAAVESADDGCEVD